jgi:hypothetical protein
MRVIRILVFLAIVAGGALIAAPFILSWRAIDERGIEIPGKVESKREYVRVRYSNWERVREAMVFYTPPDGHGPSAVTAKLDEAHFDQLRTGRPTTLRYLRREDMPRLPGAETLRDMRLLPVAKLPGQYVYETKVVRALQWALCGVLLLVFWRVLRLPAFPLVAAGVGVLLVVALNSEFPRPTPEPRAGVRTATGRIGSVQRIESVFSGSRSRGVEAAQPIDVVGVEFTPAPGAEPVLAVDLLDAGSLDLKPGVPVVVSYEAEAPRTARIQGGTRQFAEKNLRGAIVVGGLSVAVLLGGFLLFSLIGRALKAAIQRPLRGVGNSPPSPPNPGRRPEEIR